MKEQDQEKRFEDVIREQAEGFELKPSDNVWANIKLALVEEQRRRRFIWLRAAIIALLVGSGILGWLVLGDHNNNDSNTGEASEVVKHNSDTIELTDDSNSINSITEGPASSVATPITAGANESASSYSEKTKAIDGVKKSSASSMAPVTQNEIQNTSAGENGIETYSTQDEEIALLQNNREPKPIPWYNTATDDDDLKALTSKTENINDACIRPHRFSVEAEVIPMISYRTLTNASSANESLALYQPHFDSLARQMNQYNKPLVSFSVGIYANYRAWKKWDLGVGVHFSRCGEQLGLAQSMALTADTVSTGVNPSNIPEFTPGDDTYISYHHDWADIDARIGYVILGDEKNEVSVLGGGGVSLLLPSKSQWQSGNNSDESMYKDAAMTVHAGFNYKRMLSSDFALSAGIQAHYYVTQVYNSTQTSFSEHPYWGGLNLGFAYRF